MASLSWADFDLQSLFPSEFVTLINTIDTVLNTVIGIIEPIVAIINALAALIDDFLDPLAALLQALIDEIDNLINDTINANVFILYQKLPTELGLFGYRGGKDATRGRSAAATVEEIAESMFDLGDANRPIFSESASVGGVIMMVGAPSASQFNQLVQDFNKLFGIKDWEDWLERQQRRFEVSSNVPGVITGIDTDDGPPPVGTLIDARQTIDEVPENPYIRMLNGSTRGQVFRVISAVSGGAETIPESERVEGNDGVIFTVDPIPFGVQQNRRNFEEILANLNSDLGIEPSDDGVEVFEQLREDPFFLFSSIRAGTIDGDSISGDRYAVETGTFDSLDPDWSKLPLTEVFIPLTPLFDTMDSLIDVLGVAKQGSTAILELVEIINQKLALYAEIVTELDQIIDDITAALGATGFHILTIPGETGGIDNFVNTIRTADNLPPFGSGDYTTAVTVVAAGPDLTALLALFS